MEVKFIILAGISIGYIRFQMESETVNFFNHSPYLTNEDNNTTSQTCRDVKMEFLHKQ